MDCPKCGLINPESAQRCDCGYDFGTGEIKQSYLTKRDKQVAKRHEITAFGIDSFLLLLCLIDICFAYANPATWQIMGAVALILLWSVRLWIRRSAKK